MASENLAAATETAMKRLKEKKATDFIVSASRSSGNELKFVNNEIVKTSINNDVELSIFAVFGKKIVLTSIKELESGKIKKAIEKLSKFSKGTMPKDDYFGIADGPFKYKPVKRTYDEKIPNLSASGQVDYVEAGVNAALAQGAARASGIFELQQNSTYIGTSRNVAAKSEKTQAYFSIRALIDKDASGHNTSAACMLRDFDTSKAGASAGEIARLSQKPEKGKSGKYDVIFAPLALAPLLSIAGNASSIFSVEAGFSFFKGRINTNVASPSVTLTDNGPLEGAYGATPFDDEGVPTQKNTLIDKGKFKTYLYNTSFSRKYNTKSTGNAGLIDPSPWHVVLENGKLTKEKLFASVKNGIYISNVWYTRFQNYSTGDFSTIPRDGMFLIKNGELHKPVKQLRISENMINVLKNISSVANDSRQIWSWEIGETGTPVTLPHVLVKKVNLTEPTA